MSTGLDDGGEGGSAVFSALQSVAQFLLVFSVLTVLGFVSLVLRVLVCRVLKVRMSILLTASRKSVAKSAKNKKKRSLPQAVPQNFNPTPPISTDKTKVWYWELEGMPTTVMFSKDTNEVWCNGTILDTIDQFTEGGEAYNDGATVDFCIDIQHSGVSHKARIRRYATGERGGIGHQLCVDGYQIEEHTGAQYYQDPYCNQPTDTYTANYPYGEATDVYPYPFRPDPQDDGADDDDETPEVPGYSGGYAPEEGAVAFNPSYTVPGPPCYEDVMAQQDKKNQ